MRRMESSDITTAWEKTSLGEYFLGISWSVQCTHIDILTGFIMYRALIVFVRTRLHQLYNARSSYVGWIFCASALTPFWSARLLQLLPEITTRLDKVCLCLQRHTFRWWQRGPSKPSHANSRPKRLRREGVGGCMDAGRMDSWEDVEKTHKLD